MQNAWFSRFRPDCMYNYSQNGFVWQKTDFGCLIVLPANPRHPSPPLFYVGISGNWLPKPATSQFPHKRRSLRETWCREALGFNREPCEPCERHPAPTWTGRRGVLGCDRPPTPSGNGSRLLPQPSYERAWQRACPERPGLFQRASGDVVTMVPWSGLLSGRASPVREPSEGKRCTRRAGWSNDFVKKKFPIFCTTNGRRKD